MLLAVFSDIHDNLKALEQALRAVAQADALIFCGDLCAPFTLKALAEGFPGPVHTVWGNNDGDRWLMTEIAQKAGNVTLHGDFAEMEFNGYKVAAVHYPRLGYVIAHAHLHDLVCYGHDHQAHLEWVGTTALLNPGELMGRFGKCTYALVDTETRTVGHYEI